MLGDMEKSEDEVSSSQLLTVKRVHVRVLYSAKTKCIAFVSRFLPIDDV